MFRDRIWCFVGSHRKKIHCQESIQRWENAVHEEDFVTICANWEPKDQNLLHTAETLSLLPESFVFVDDNPAERDIVSAQIPGIAVPAFDSPTDCIRVLDHAGYFETTTFSAADANRSEMYRANAQRAQMQQTYANYTDYLLGLDRRSPSHPTNRRLPVTVSRRY